MPPNDDLFDATATAADAAAATQTDTAADTERAAAADASPGLTAEQVEAIVAQRTAPVASQLSALQRENDALKLAIERGAQPVQSQATGATEDFVTQFNRNPEAAVRALAEQSSSDGLRQLAPHLNTLISSANEAFLGAQQTRIEQEFGPKAWEEVYQPALAERFAAIRRENPFAVADINLVRREADTITGQNFTKLAEMRDAHLKGRTSASEAERAKIIEEARRGITTNLTGGIRNAPKDAPLELDPALKQAIAEMDMKTGSRTDPKEWAKKYVAVQNAKSIEDYLANVKPQGRA